MRLLLYNVNSVTFTQKLKNIYDDLVDLQYNRDYCRTLLVGEVYLNNLFMFA